MLKLYGLAMASLEPLAPLILRMRARAGKEDPERLGERLGHASLPRPPGALVWLHGASVGETLSLLPLVEVLKHKRPDLTLLVTSGTLTSAHILGRRLPAGVIHQYLPLDTPAIARRFLDHWRPALAVFVESELWPGLLTRAKVSGIRLALLGARLSHASARGWARAPGAARSLLRAFDLILAQDEISRRRLQRLGGEVAGELDLKQAGAPLPCDEAALAELRAATGRRPVVVVASTHPGEDEIAATAFRSLNAPSALLILVPRHPERGAAIASGLRARGWAVAQRSLGQPIDGGVQVYVADTLGELGLIYRLAQVVIMGGGFTGGVGGHNPLEPARLALPIIAGSDTANFREAYASLIATQAALIADTPSALAQALAELMADPMRAQQMGQKAKAYAARGDEALEAAFRALGPLLPEVVP